MTESVPDAAVQTITYKRQVHQKKQADLLAAFPVRKELLLSRLRSKGWIISNMLISAYTATVKT